MALLSWIRKAPSPEQNDMPVVKSRLSVLPAKKVTEAPELPILKFDADIVASRHILYVTQNVAHTGLVRELFNAHRRDWAVQFAEANLETQLLLKVETFDAVICDFAKPLDSNEFLSLITASHPRIHRFVVCDASDRSFLKKWKGAPPRRIERRTDFSSFETELEEAFEMDTWLSNAAVKALLVHIRKLPALPSLYARITAELEAADPSIDLIASLISEEPIMTAKILQFVNSGYFGLSSRYDSTRDAVMFLGKQRTRAIVLLASVFSKFEDTRCPGFSLPDFAAHSLTVANFAATIVKEETRDQKLADTAFTAGLLHDLGRLLMAANLPDSYNQVISIAIETNQSLIEVEQEVYGTTHAELGACLLATWGQTPAIVNSVGLHHAPSRSGDRSFTLLTALHAANALDQRPGKGKPPAIDSSYLQSAGAIEHFEKWRDLCLCDR